MLVFAIAPSHAAAAQTYTYEFVEGRGVYYRSGDAYTSGYLTGSFSLEVDGSQLSMKSFDILRVQFRDLRSPITSKPDLPLADILDVDFLASTGIV